VLDAALYQHASARPRSNHDAHAGLAGSCLFCRVFLLQVSKRAGKRAGKPLLAFRPTPLHFRSCRVANQLALVVRRSPGSQGHTLEKPTVVMPALKDHGQGWIVYTVPSIQPGTDTTLEKSEFHLILCQLPTHRPGSHQRHGKCLSRQSQFAGKLP